jgi:hypothetical protein
VRYHGRGYAGCSCMAAPFSIAEHAVDLPRAAPASRHRARARCGPTPDVGAG